MRRPFTRLTNFLATGFTAIASLFSKPEPRTKKKGPRRVSAGDLLIGKPDARVPSNVHVLSERIFDDGTVMLSGYNCKHHPRGLPAEKGQTYYKVADAQS